MAYPVAVNKQLNMNSWSYKQLESLTQPAVMVQLSSTDVISRIKYSIHFRNIQWPRESFNLSTWKWFSSIWKYHFHSRENGINHRNNIMNWLLWIIKFLSFFSLTWILPKFTTWRIVTVSNKTWYHKRPNKLQSWRRHRNIVHEFPRPSSLSYENCHVNHVTCQFCYFQRIHLIKT